jgi:hypothetical protein
MEQITRDKKNTIDSDEVSITIAIMENSRMGKLDTQEKMASVLGLYLL